MQYFHPKCEEQMKCVGVVKAFEDILFYKSETLTERLLKLKFDCYELEFLSL